MTERQSNLLLSDAAQPANGVQWATAVPHYGGPLNVTASGVWGGATVALGFSTKLPADGESYDGALADTDIIPLDSFTANDFHATELLNPCVLIVTVSATHSTTRVRVVVN